jgi:hypothetical protein
LAYLHNYYAACIISLHAADFNIKSKKAGKSRDFPAFYPTLDESLAGTHLCEALAAVDGTIRLRLKGHASLTAAGSAGSREILTGTAGRVLAGDTAGLAALGLILEALLGVKLLLTGGEHELLAAFLAHKGLVFEHFESSL